MAKTKRLTQVRAGRIVRAVVYDQPMAGDEPRVRAAKTRHSSAAREKLNAKASWEKCEATMAANFDRRDLWVTLTYREAPPTREDAMRQLGAFLRLLRAARLARGAELLYLKNAEHLRDDGSEGRWHHHLVINAAGGDYEEIRGLWSRWGDDVDFEPLLDGDHDYEARARYMCKERPPLGKQAWTPSKGLRRPVRTSELVDESLTLAPPPGAVILDRDQKENAWGSFVYIKYLLPYKEPRPKRQRSVFSGSGQCISSGNDPEKTGPGHRHGAGSGLK